MVHYHCLLFFLAYILAPIYYIIQPAGEPPLVAIIHGLLFVLLLYAHIQFQYGVICFGYDVRYGIAIRVDVYRAFEVIGIMTLGPEAERPYSILPLHQFIHQVELIESIEAIAHGVVVILAVHGDVVVIGMEG